MASPLDGLYDAPQTNPLNGLYPQEQAPTPNKTPIAEELENIYGNEFTKGFRRGAIGMLGTTQAFAGQLMEPLFPDAAKKMFDEARQTLDFEPGLRPKVEKWGDVKDVGTFVDYGLSKMGEGAPTTLGSFAGAGAGAAAGLGLRALGMRAASAGLGATVGGAASMFPQEAGESAMTLQDDPAAMTQTTPLSRLGISSAKGAVNSVLESLPERLAIGRAFQMPVGRAGVRGILESTARGAGEAVVGEGLTEGVQELTGQAAHSLANPQRDTKSDWGNVGEAAIGGAFGGLGFGAAGGAIHGVRSNLVAGGDKVTEVVEPTKNILKRAWDALPDAPTPEEALTFIRTAAQDPEWFGQKTREAAEKGVEHLGVGYRKLGEIAALAGEKGKALLDTGNLYIDKALSNADTLDKAGERINREWLFKMKSEVGELTTDALETLKRLAENPTDRWAQERLGLYAKGMITDTLPKGVGAAVQGVKDFYKGLTKSVDSGLRASQEWTDAKTDMLNLINQHDELGKQIRNYDLPTQRALYGAIDTLDRAPRMFFDKEGKPNELYAQLTAALGTDPKKILGYMQDYQTYGRGITAQAENNLAEQKADDVIASVKASPDPKGLATKLAEGVGLDEAEQEQMKALRSRPSQRGIDEDGNLVGQPDEQGFTREGQLNEIEPNPDLPISHDVLNKSLQDLYWYDKYDPNDKSKALPHLMLKLRDVTEDPDVLKMTPEEILKSFSFRW
jgi:hypothetical protein